MAVCDIFGIVVVECSRADVLIQLTLDVPGSTAVLRVLRSELNVRELDDDLEAPFAVISSDIHAWLGHIFVQIQIIILSWPFPLGLNVFWCSESSWFGLNHLSGVFFPIISSVPELIFCLSIFLLGLLVFGHIIRVGVENSFSVGNSLEGIVFSQGSESLIPERDCLCDNTLYDLVEFSISMRM